MESERGERAAEAGSDRWREAGIIETLCSPWGSVWERAANLLRGGGGGEVGACKRGKVVEVNVSMKTNQH